MFGALGIARNVWPVAMDHVEESRLLAEPVKQAIMDGKARVYESVWGTIFVVVDGGKHASTKGS